MLLGPNKKKLATLILSRAKPEFFSDSGYDTEKKEESLSDDTIALDAAADKVFSAIESKDKEGFIQAIKSIFMILEASEPEGD